MKNKLYILNLFLLTVSVVMTFVYHVYSGIGLKILTALVFVILCFANMVYIVKCNSEHKKLAFFMFAGQIVCLVGDVVLWYNFMIGAIIFGIGHLFFIVAYSFVEKYNVKDICPCVILAFISISVILFVPIFDYGFFVMKIVCAIYGIIISVMVGKAFSNFMYKKVLGRGLILLGSVLFFTSDLMLLFYMFAGAAYITDVICLFTYFPGQCILAHSLYYIAKEKN